MFYVEAVLIVSDCFGATYTSGHLWGIVNIVVNTSDNDRCMRENLAKKRRISVSGT